MQIVLYCVDDASRSMCATNSVPNIEHFFWVNGPTTGGLAVIVSFHTSCAMGTYMVSNFFPSYFLFCSQ